MTDDIVTNIEAWFAKNDGDGHFVYPPRNHPYSLIGVSRTAGTIVYCSKFIRYLECHECKVPDNIGFLHRCGLPNGSDLGWMRQVVGKRKLLFFGDLDPVDLLVFSWLRHQLRDVRLHHFGINDALLTELGFDPSDSNTIPLLGSEKRAMQVLAKNFPDFSEVVGVRCAALLARGYKLEIEAIPSWDRTRNSLFSALGCQ